MSEPGRKLPFYPVRLTATEIREALAVLGPTGTRAEARVKAAAHAMADLIEARAGASSLSVEAPQLDVDRLMALVNDGFTVTLRPHSAYASEVGSELVEGVTVSAWRRDGPSLFSTARSSISGALDDIYARRARLGSDRPGTEGE